MEDAKLIALLNRLIGTCRDGHAGYRVAAHGIEDMALKRLLGKISRERKLFEEQLRDYVRKLGGKPRGEHGSMPGALHRGWLQIREDLGHPSRDVLLKECRRGEAVSVRLYREALANELPPALRRVLAIHAERIVAASERITGLVGEET